MADITLSNVKFNKYEIKQYKDTRTRRFVVSVNWHYRGIGLESGILIDKEV